MNWSTDRSIVMDLRREVTRWITRVFPVPSAQSTSLAAHIEVLGSLLQQWMVFYKNSFPQGQGESPPQRALQWLIRIHLDSHCFGFINVPKASIEGATDNTSEETLQVDRGLLTIQSVGQISKLSTDLQFQPLIPIFADTCSDVARTLNASVTIKLLLESLESSQNAEIDSHSFISFVTQQVIAEVIEAQFFIVVKKIEQRIDIQYSKAKKWAPLEELQELENRKLNPPIWEYYNELLTSEPEVRISRF